MVQFALVGGIVGGTIGACLDIYGTSYQLGLWLAENTPGVPVIMNECNALVCMFVVLMFQGYTKGSAARTAVGLRVVRHIVVVLIGVNEIVYTGAMFLFPAGANYLVGLNLPWRRMIRSTRSAASTILVQPQSDDGYHNDDGSFTPFCPRPQNCKYCRLAFGAGESLPLSSEDEGGDLFQLFNSDSDSDSSAEGLVTPPATTEQTETRDAQVGYIKLVEQLKGHSLLDDEDKEFSPVDNLLDGDILDNSDGPGTWFKSHMHQLTKLSNLALSICDYARRDNHSALATLTFFRNIVRDLELSEALQDSFMSCVRVIHCRFLQENANTEPVVEPQSIPSLGEFKKVINGCKQFARNKLPGLVKQLLGLMVSTLLAPNLLGCTSKVWRMLGSVVKRRSTKENFLENIVDNTWEMLEDGIDWLMTDEASPDIVKTLAASKEMREYAALNGPSMNTSERSDWKDNYQFVHSRLVQLYAREVKESSFVHSNALDRERELLHAAFCKVVRVRPEDKKEALCMIAVGDPGIGKSLLSQLIQDIIAVSTQGTFFDPHQVSIIGPTKFFDTLSNLTKVIIVDDIMSGMLEGTQPNAACVNSKISELIIAAINPVVWTPPMASLEAKGNTFPDLSLLMMTANWENGYGDMAQAKCPSAAARRATRVEVHLKDEYAGNDGKLDLTKVDKSDLFTKCPWRITVKKYNVAKAAAVNNGGLSSKLVPKAYEVASLMTDDGPILLQDVDTETFRRYILQEVRASHNRGDIAVGIRTNTRERVLELAQPQSLFDLGFYDVDNSQKWMPWARTGRVDLSVRQEINQLCGESSTRLGLCKTLFRCVVLFPLGLLLHYALRRSNQGVRKTLRLFYSLALADLAIGALMKGADFPGAQMVVPAARGYVLSWSRCGDSVLRAARRARMGTYSACHRLKRYHKPIAVGLFAGLSLYAIRSFIRFVKRNREVYNLVESERRKDWSSAFLWVEKERFAREEARMPEHPERPKHASGQADESVSDIAIGGPPNTNSALLMRARSEVYKGPHGGKNTDTVSGDKSSVIPTRRTASFDQVATCVSAAQARVIVTGLSSPELSAVVPGTTARQFMIIVGQCHTGARAMVNAHLFARECKWFSVQVLWNPGRTNRPFILHASQIAFATDMAPMVLGGADGLLDLAVFSIPDFGAVRSIVDCFAESATYEPTALVAKRLGCKTYDGDYCHKAGLSITPGRIIGPASVRYDKTSAANTRLLAVEVQGDGVKGQCGMAVFSGSCVIGIHSAGRKDAGTVLITPVTRSTLEELFALHDTLVSPLTSESGTAGSITVTPESLAFAGPWKEHFPGPLEKEFAVHEKSFVRRICDNSKYSLQGQLGNMRTKFISMYKPNPLKKVVVKHVPLVSDIVKGYAPPLTDLDACKNRMLDLTEHATVADPDALRVAELHVHAYLKSALLKTLAEDADLAGVGPTDLSTALDGFDMPLAGRVDITTSAGLMSGAKSKYIDSVHNPTLGRNSLMFKPDDVSQSIPQCIEEGINRLRAGEALGMTATVVGKDEVLPMEQNVEGINVPKMARLIHAGDVSSLLIFRMLFMPLLAVMGSDPIQFGHFVGLNPITDFSRMYEHLGAWDEVSYMAMDYSKFDMRTSVNLINAAVNILIALTKNLKGYTDEHRKMMRTLCFDICNPIYNMDGIWIRFTGSNSSGNPITTVLNCIVNHLCWNQMWLMADHDRRFPQMRGHYYCINPEAMSFYSFAKVVVLGDDCIVTVPLDFWFNQLTAAEYAVKLGQVLTSAIKGAEITPFMRGVTFLKREIHVYRHASGKDLVLAPLALTSLLRPLAWGTWKTGLIEHMAGLIKGMLIELVQHGPVVYADYCVQFRNLISECYVDHQKRTKNGTLRESLSSYFTEEDFRPWGERIMETYGIDAAGLLDEPVTVV